MDSAQDTHCGQKAMSGGRSVQHYDYSLYRYRAFVWPPAYSKSMHGRQRRPVSGKARATSAMRSAAGRRERHSHCYGGETGPGSCRYFALVCQPGEITSECCVSFVEYRGHYLHDGSAASLEEMFDPDLLKEDHVFGAWTPLG